uniref:Uncharacterized protein n=1 Tax=Arundo donax TaxID=35708 RepID=A0A0A9GZK5_ARUDO
MCHEFFKNKFIPELASIHQSCLILVLIVFYSNSPLFCLVHREIGKRPAIYICLEVVSKRFSFRRINTYPSEGNII